MPSKPVHYHPVSKFTYCQVEFSKDRTAFKFTTDIERVTCQKCLLEIKKVLASKRV